MEQVSDIFSVESIGKRIASQDNRMTANPIFEVQELKRTYGIDVDCDPEIAWLWSDESVEVPRILADLAEEYWYNNEKEPGAIETDNGKYKVGLGDGYSEPLRRVGYFEDWVHVQPFFTEVGAQSYIDCNGHNHKGRLRIYVGSEFRNREWQAVRALLARIGEKA